MDNINKRLWRASYIAGVAILGGFAGVGLVWLASLLMVGNIFRHPSGKVVDGVIVAHIVGGTIGFIVGLVVSLSSRQRLSQAFPYGISEKGRWAFYIGVMMAPISMCLYAVESIARIVGERALPYVFFGAMIASGFACLSLYKYIPKAWAVPLGMAGWIVSLALILWYGLVRTGVL
jgi:hypothetical protein